MATKDELLLSSLEDGPETQDAETAWDAELERRAREVLDGTVKTIPWEEVEARVNRRHGGEGRFG